MMIPPHAPRVRFILAMVWIGCEPSRGHEFPQELLVSLNARIAAGPQDAGARRERAGSPAAARIWRESWMAGHPRLTSLEMEALRLELAGGRQEPALQRPDRLIREAPHPEFLLLGKARHLQEWQRLPEAGHQDQRCLDAIEALPSHQPFLPVVAGTRIAARAMIYP